MIVLILLIVILFGFLLWAHEIIKSLKVERDWFVAEHSKLSDQVRLKGIEVVRLNKVVKNQIKTIENARGWK